MHEFRLGPTAEVVEAAVERVPRYPGGPSYPLPVEELPEELQQAWAEAGGKDTYTFPNIKTLDRVALGAMNLIINGRIQEAIDSLNQNCIPNYDEKDSIRKWAHFAVQMPGDWGPRNPSDRVHMRENLTSMSRGIVLEAMCGFTSYIAESPNISKVIAMDFCREALELYEPSDRTRILFDLDKISENGGIDFFEDESVDTILITFGVDYLENPSTVYTEFHRILVPDGKLLIVGGRDCGYPDLLKQHFAPAYHARLLREAGFITQVEPLPYGGQGDDAEFSLIEATRQGSQQLTLSFL